MRTRARAYVCVFVYVRARACVYICVLVCLGVRADAFMIVFNHQPSVKGFRNVKTFIYILSGYDIHRKVYKAYENPRPRQNKSVLCLKP